METASRKVIDGSKEEKSSGYHAVHFTEQLTLLERFHAWLGGTSVSAYRNYRLDSDPAERLASVRSPQSHSASQSMVEIDLAGSAWSCPVKG